MIFIQIGLIDVDSHNFPNLPLMKISAYLKKLKYNVEWWFPLKHYNALIKSRVFTDEYTTEDKTVINADYIFQGGTGYDLENYLPYEIEHIYPDYSLYPQLTKNTAYGFLSRGCPRDCPFCIVSKKEGKKSIKCADLEEFWSGQRIIKLLDPNLLASKEQKNLLTQLSDSHSWVDFTQGLDACFVNNYNVDLLASIKVKMIHFAFDLIKNKKQIVEGLKLYKEATNIAKEKTGVYILTNYNTTHEEDLYRIQVVKNLGYFPYVMIYNKNSAPKETLRLQRWANNKMIYAATKGDFKNYR